MQEYGKQASNFTKEKLKNAAEYGTIVLAGVYSTYGIPSMDANGRHLCRVWINENVQNAPVDTLVNIVIRTPLSQIRICGRNTSGVKIMNLEYRQRIISIAIFPQEDIEEDLLAEEGHTEE